MADGLCSGEPFADVMEKTAVQDNDNALVCEKIDSADGGACENVKNFYMASESAKLFDKIYVKSGHEGFICEEDFRKKRCVDRYDSSESSDSGVAALSCTDCSGSSTASSDIAEPGSPFSTASSHSEDSGSASQPPRMPPTPPTAHHPPWPWTPAAAPAAPPDDDGPPPRKKTAFPTRLTAISPEQYVGIAPGPNHLHGKLQQGKITEYFKSQVRLNTLRKDLFQYAKKPAGAKTVSSADQQTQLNGAPKPPPGRPPSKKMPAVRKAAPQKPPPRRILPAPADAAGKLSIDQQLNQLAMARFAPTVTLAALAFPPGYLQPPPAVLGVVQQQQQQPGQRLALNGFGGVKLNATVVPIVKVKALPSSLHTAPELAVTLSLETAVPTVMAAKPRAGNGHAHHAHHAPPPSSSQAADADSDSGVSVRGAATEEGAGPILSPPTTIRFPAGGSNNKGDGKSPPQSADGVCRWDGCEGRFDTSGALLEHLQVKHVISQTTQEQYVCLWLGCKVHGRTSCSRSWLERHVLAHAGTKPFRCIVEGCGQRFNSQLMLERHVNGHFNSDGSPNTTVKKSPENGSCKLFKRNGKRIRFRRQPWSARMFDFIDPGIMEGIQHNLLMSTQKRTLGKISDLGDTVHLRSEILARRVENDGNIKYLLRWHPTDVAPDEWVLEKEYKPTRIVSIPLLDSASKDALRPSLFPSQPRRKHSRKPILKQT